MYLCHRYTGASLPEIGRALGREHPAVRNAIAMVERAVLERAPLRYQVEELAARLDQRGGARAGARRHLNAERSPTPARARLLRPDARPAPGEAPARRARELALDLRLERRRILRRVVEAAQDLVGGAALDRRAADLADQAAHLLGRAGSRRGCEPDSRLIDSSISVPPKSLAPDEQRRAAPSFGPIFTHDIWTFCDPRAAGRGAPPRSRAGPRGARRPGRACRWLKSTFFSWMKPSGTNSVKPPVSFWMSRISARWRATWRGSSMWPYITVEVERSPIACAAVTISTQRVAAELVAARRSGGSSRRGSRPRCRASCRGRRRRASAGTRRAACRSSCAP